MSQTEQGGFDNFDRLDEIVEKEYGFRIPQYANKADYVAERRRAVEAVTFLLRNRVFTDEEIKFVLKDSPEHLEFLRRMSFRGEIADLLMITAKGVKIVKADDARTGTVQETVRKLSTLTPEQWISLQRDALSTDPIDGNEFFEMFRPFTGLPKLETLSRAADHYLGGGIRNAVDTLRDFAPVQTLKGKFILLGLENALGKLDLNTSYPNKEFFPQLSLKRIGASEPISGI